MNYDSWKQRGGVFVLTSLVLVLMLLLMWRQLLFFTEHIKFIGIMFLIISHIGIALIIILQDQNICLTKKVHQLQELEKKLRYYSYYDAMSGVYNRNAFIQEAKALGSEKTGIAVILCDIDGLKLINDTLGHNKGDQLIRATAEILTTVCSAIGRVYRMGGDEFLVLSPTVATEAQLIDLASHIHQAVELYNKEHDLLSISLGWALADNRSMLTELIKMADCKMYQEKMSRREQVRQKMTQSLIQ